MHKLCGKYKNTRAFIQTITPAEMIGFFSAQMPDHQFHFITFEGDDYCNDILTFLLFNFIPDRIFVTVPANANIAAAVAEVKSLNPGVKLVHVPLSYTEEDDLLHHRISHEYRIFSTGLKINEDGSIS